MVYGSCYYESGCFYAVTTLVVIVLVAVRWTSISQKELKGFRLVRSQKTGCAEALRSPPTHDSCPYFEKWCGARLYKSCHFPSKAISSFHTLHYPNHPANHDINLSISEKDAAQSQYLCNTPPHPLWGCLCDSGIYGRCPAYDFI